VLAGCSSGDGDDRPAPAPERGPVGHLRALAAVAERNGGERAAGTPGYAASVRYVAGALRRLGWRVRIQEVPLRLPREAAPPRLAIQTLGALEPLRDFRTLSYSGGGRGAGRLVAAGDGCRREDFAQLGRAAVALVERGGCFNLVKARNASAAGARALLVSANAPASGVPSATLTVPARLPVLALRGALARRLRGGERVSFAVSSSVRRATTQNVIAEAGEGERVAMAGAHLDSVPGGPGMNDNASGVAVLLAAAEDLGPRPPGRVRLGFWGAEELALLGSRHYASRLGPAERRRLVGYLNLDMVGSPNAVVEVYGDADPALARILRASHPGREGEVAAAGRSDHAAFADAGVPVAGLYTGSEERGPGARPRDPCYHLPCDGLANVDRAVLRRMALATATALRRLAE
jgi:Iap family predicted aminopeptidase